MREGGTQQGRKETKKMKGDKEKVGTKKVNEINPRTESQRHKEFHQIPTVQISNCALRAQFEFVQQGGQKCPPPPGGLRLMFKILLFYCFGA